MKSFDLPRLLIGATGSGCGKTTVTCGLLALMKKKGLSPVSFKCGPDYIDPMFHRQVLGVPSGNLDLFFSSQEQVQSLLARKSTGHHVAVLEGVMGYYDGVGGTTTQASSYHLASATKTPTLLVVEGRGRSLSLAAEVLGFLQFRKDSQISAIFLNQVSPMLFPRLKEQIEKETGLPVVGYLPPLKEPWPSRHLGLVTPGEMDQLEDCLEQLAGQLEKTLDWDKLWQICTQAEPLTLEEVEAMQEPCVTIAVAQDEAFCFYYEENLRMLKRCGCRLVPFSPLHDEQLPQGIDGILLGGGYPELYGEQLSQSPITAQLKKVLGEGMPCLAECGGYLYLHETLEDEEGHLWPMVGVLGGSSARGKGLGRFGYISISPKEDTPYLKQGEIIRGHEFHYWQSSREGTACQAEKPVGSRGWPCMESRGHIFCGFPHLYYPSCPQLPERFAAACRAFGERRKP